MSFHVAIYPLPKIVYYSKYQETEATIEIFYLPTITRILVLVIFPQPSAPPWYLWTVLLISCQSHTPLKCKFSGSKFSEAAFYFFFGMPSWPSKVI